MPASWGQPSTFQGEQAPLLQQSNQFSQPPGRPLAKPWKDLQGPDNFTVTLHKRPGDKLGFGANRKGQVLEIIQVKGGLLTKWNTDNPDRRVKVGDLIVDVNGLTGDSEGLDTLLKAPPAALNMLISRKKQDKNSWSIVTGWLRETLCSALLFMVVSVLFMLGYHQNPRLLQILATFLALVCFSKALLLYLHWSKFTKGVLFWLVFTFAVVSGGIVGTSIHLNELHDYWPYYQKRHYTNVAPDELAAAHSDASVLVFMEGARPDASRYAGYWRYGSVYCVAPIAIDSSYIEGEDKASNNAQYWAIGKNCCGGNKGFACDDSQDPLARSGLVMLKKTDDDTLMQGIISNDDMAYYEKAVLMSLSKFDLTSPDERLYVRFVKDIEQARLAYWRHAWWSWWKMQLIFLMLWMFAGAMAVLVGVGDKNDESRYSDHIGDFKQSVLWNLNHYI